MLLYNNKNSSSPTLHRCCAASVLLILTQKTSSSSNIRSLSIRYYKKLTHNLFNHTLAFLLLFFLAFSFKGEKTTIRVVFFINTPFSWRCSVLNFVEMSHHNQHLMLMLFNSFECTSEIHFLSSLRKTSSLLSFFFKFSHYSTKIICWMRLEGQKGLCWTTEKSYVYMKFI